MKEKKARCQLCGQEVSGTIGRSAACPSCGADLHACQQCEFYDPYASNQCREPHAEKVGDKERSNFCELFRLNWKEGGTPAPGVDDARQRLEALFKKG